MKIAQKFNEKVEMSESEFRNLMVDVFDNVPSYHLKSIVRGVKKGGKKGRFEKLSYLIRDVE
jgi:hypothetical protein